MNPDRFRFFRLNFANSSFCFTPLCFLDGFFYFAHQQDKNANNNSNIVPETSIWRSQRLEDLSAFFRAPEGIDHCCDRMAHFPGVPIHLLQQSALFRDDSHDNKPTLFTMGVECVHDGEGKRIGEILNVLQFEFETNAQKMNTSKVFKQILHKNDLRFFTVHGTNKNSSSLYLCIDHMVYSTACSSIKWYQDKLEAYWHDLGLANNMQSCRSFGPIDLPKNTGDHVYATCLFHLILDEQCNSVRLELIDIPFPPVKSTREPVAMLTMEQKKHPSYSPNVTATYSIPDDLRIYPIIQGKESDTNGGVLQFFTMNTTGAAFLYNLDNDSHSTGTLLWKKCEPDRECDKKIMNYICEGKFHADCRQLFAYDLRIFILLNKNGVVNIGNFLYGDFYEIFLTNQHHEESAKFRLDLICTNILFPENYSIVIDGNKNFAYSPMQDFDSNANAGEDASKYLCISSQFSPLPLKQICYEKICGINQKIFREMYPTNLCTLPNDIFIQNLLEKYNK